jgi:hypothetical protein
MSRHSTPEQIRRLLSEETVALRDRIKATTGKVLTVEDAQVALDALTAQLAGQAYAKPLSNAQCMLVELWKKRLAELEDDEIGEVN